MGDENNTFHTQKGYDLKNEGVVTYAMEDYLEMVCRYAKEEGFIRIGTLAKLLNVKASSASKMAANLKKAGLINYEKYGLLFPTGKGLRYGEFLLYRHDTVNRFFCMINRSKEELELTEQIEHYIKKDTVKNMEHWILAFENSTTE